MNSNPAPEYAPSIAFRRLLFDSAQRRHPLARSIEPHELLPLSKALHARFTQAGVDDYLDTVLGIHAAGTEYAQQVARRGPRFTDEDHLGIMRGIAASLGNSYLSIAGSIWVKVECLLENSVAEQRSMTLRRGAERRTVTRTTISIGCLAADVWHAALSGDIAPVNLYMTAYVEDADGQGHWEYPRVRILSAGEKASDFPSAWRLVGL